MEKPINAKIETNKPFVVITVKQYENLKTISEQLKTFRELIIAYPNKQLCKIFRTYEYHELRDFKKHALETLKQIQDCAMLHNWIDAYNKAIHLANTIEQL